MGRIAAHPVAIACACSAGANYDPAFLVMFIEYSGKMISNHTFIW